MRLTIIRRNMMFIFNVLGKKIACFVIFKIGCKVGRGRILTDDDRQRKRVTFIIFGEIALVA